MSIVNPKTYVCTSSSCTVGSGDSSKFPNAIASTDIGIVVIPKLYNGTPVTSVGHSAFRLANRICEVKIYAELTMIGQRAFSDMISLRTINIPETLTKIDEFGLQFSNSGISNGTVFIIFEGKSSLSYIGQEVFGYKTKVVINYTSTKSPKCASSAFRGTENALIYAPTSFLFCEKYKTKPWTQNNTCRKANSSKRSAFNIYIISSLLCH